MNNMSGKTSPTILCRKLDDVDIDDWSALDKMFASAEFAQFQQGWVAKEEADFRPAKVAAVWTDEELIVYAVLNDDDIYNEISEEAFNKLSIEYGDVFEIFLKPEDQDAYFELHINPNNQKFQARFPFRNPFAKLKEQYKSTEEMLEAMKIWEPIIQSRVKIDREAGKWQVVAAIPFSMLVEGAPVKDGTRWSFSFCRYDYTRPVATPVYSSSSAHSAINYHMIDEYGTLCFKQD